MSLVWNSFVAFFFLLQVLNVLRSLKKIKFKLVTNFFRLSFCHFSARARPFNDERVRNVRPNACQQTVVWTQMKIFITTEITVMFFPKILQIHVTNLTVKLNLSAKCLLAIICTKTVLAKKKKKKSLVLLQQTVATLG